MFVPSGISGLTFLFHFFFKLKAFFFLLFILPLWYHARFIFLVFFFDSHRLLDALQIR